MPNFRLEQTLHENIEALRKALGSVVRELSRDALGDLIQERHPEKRPINSTTVARWESGESEPDLHSIRIMAELAGVPMEQFAFGAKKPEGDGDTIHDDPDPLGGGRAGVPDLTPAAPSARRAAAKKKRGRRRKSSGG